MGKSAKVKNAHCTYTRARALVHMLDLFPVFVFFYKKKRIKKSKGRTVRACLPFPTTSRERMDTSIRTLKVFLLPPFLLPPSAASRYSFICMRVVCVCARVRACALVQVPQTTTDKDWRCGSHAWKVWTASVQQCDPCSGAKLQ